MGVSVIFREAQGQQAPNGHRVLIPPLLKGHLSRERTPLLTCLSYLAFSLYPNTMLLELHLLLVAARMELLHVAQRVVVEGTIKGKILAQPLTGYMTDRGQIT